MAPASTHIVHFHPDAVIDFEAVKSREERKAVFNVVDKLRQVGPQLPPPHQKSLKGEPDLYELRPRAGRSAVRPIYVRKGQQLVIVAIAATKEKFDSAVVDARNRKAVYE